MQELGKNMINLFGARGKQWLSTLPKIIKVLTKKWQLTKIQPVAKMTWNYVSKAISKIHGPVILKIGCDRDFISNEIKALQYFDGHGMIKLIAYDIDHHAMLLQQAIPGTSLREIYPEKIQETIQYYSSVVSQLTSVPNQNFSHFQHINHWLKSLNKANKEKLPYDLIKKKAVRLKKQPVRF